MLQRPPVGCYGLRTSYHRWLRATTGGTRWSDTRDDIVWLHIVTFWQVAADMAFFLGVPSGRRHRYRSNVVDGWVRLSAPDGWTDADTLALPRVIDARAEQRTKIKESPG
ncbi:MAG: alpha/beta-hydrolase family protein [Acidimicrobiia bacterium]|nr:alpha/beta-hydrolase family protein [Acidimicrobiia bacterium]